MYKRLLVALVMLLTVVSFKATAQTDSFRLFPTYRVGIFAPLYLDSVFGSTNTFKYKQGIPKFILPAVEFVQGAQVALDSMKLGGENVKAFIYDTKSYTKDLDYLIQNKALDSLDLIIGSVRDADFKDLADFALQKNIPFISATYPNDGGITNNPFTVIVNSTLKAHCEAIYSYILQNHGTDKIVLCRKKGIQEDRVAAYFKQLNEQDGKALLNIQTINFDSTLNADFLQKKLDSNRNTVIIGGSLDESFASSLSLAAFDLRASYPITLIGMPNWDGFTSLYKKEVFEDFPIYFTSPYYNNKWDAFSKILIGAYAKKYKGKPSDMAYKGFETVYTFTKMLTEFPNDMMSHINDKNYKVFCDYNYKPVMLKKGASAPDYFENKHLYFIKIQNGAITKAW